MLIARNNGGNSRLIIWKQCIPANQRLHPTPLTRLVSSSEHPLEA